MKTVFRILLCVAIVVMAYLCVTSITTPIKFDETRAAREKIIIQKLTDIRNVQIEYKKLNGHYCANADSLVAFIENGKVPMVLKEGVLTDEQLKNGLTEESALAIVRSGNAKAIAENGLENFRRDTNYVTVYEAVFADKYTLDEAKKIVFVPFAAEGVKFSFDTASYTNSTTGNVTPLVQVGTEYDTYLSDLDHQQLVNLKDKERKLQENKEDKFLGLRFGSIIESNNNAGNWE
ncbi:MAG: hypothetical protein MJ002_02585 [Paludibacteraceae bacterium]|nr:hypothetical protein [Paludibacteraceae bacterium]